MSPLKVAILWHFHQPSYWDPRIGKYRYPWVFLHTTRHYHAMAHIARAHPEVRLAFNITPVLIEQLEDYLRDEPLNDVLLEAILKPASDLNKTEVDTILDHAFKLHLPTMVFPFPRYKELYAVFGSELSGAARKKISPKDIRDLQALYLLTWCGISLREEDPVRTLLEKQGDYTEDDKRSIFRAMLQAARETLPLYGELQEQGQIEVTTTPFYHPILPLLIDTAVARESRPGVDLDEVDFRFRGDARWHVEEAIRSYKSHFHRRPTGIWPAEGGVSDDALQIMADSGFLWAGTDEDILSRSLGKFGPDPREKYQPYQFSGTDLWIYFRDREISDRIGFVYSGWSPEKAAVDVLNRLKSIRDRLKGASDNACVTIILDGENPWEYYRDSGLGFLNGLYRGLVDSREIESVRFCDHRASADSAPRIHHVCPGSWIYGNFDTWIGCPEKNHAWNILSTSRRQFRLKAPEAEIPREVYRAEGSDWFWWLGPGHDTPYEASYANLFRLNLRIGLEKAQLESPGILALSVPSLPTPVFQPPIHLSTPRIDGFPGSYYDWIASGYYRASEGSFHRTRRFLEVIRFGFDLENLFIRIEGDLKSLKESPEDCSISIEFSRPEKFTLLFSNGSVKRVETTGKNSPFSAKVALEFFFEVSIPFNEIGAKEGDLVEFAVSALAGENMLDRLPQSGFVITTRPGPDFGQENWSV